MTTPQQIHLFTTSIFTNVRAKLEISVFVLFLLIANEELFKKLCGTLWKTTRSAPAADMRTTAALQGVKDNELFQHRAEAI